MPSTPLAVEIGASDGVDLAQRRAGPMRVLLPAQPILDDVAHLEVGVVGLDHLADGAAGHDLADADGRRIGRRIAHAPAHVGIEREVDDAHQHLAGPGSGIGTSSTRKSLSAGSAGGRRASTTRRWVLGIGVVIGVSSGWRPGCCREPSPGPSESEPAFDTAIAGTSAASLCCPQQASSAPEARSCSSQWPISPRDSRAC